MPRIDRDKCSLDDPTTFRYHKPKHELNDVLWKSVPIVMTA